MAEYAKRFLDWVAGMFPKEGAQERRLKDR